MLLLIIAASLAANDGMRVMLFVLVLVAVALILTGGIVALLTLYRQRKPPVADSDTSSKE